MAKSTIPLLLLLVFFTSQASAIGRKVGGRTPVQNVEQNKGVQDLGRYCVQEYNRLMQQKKCNGTAKLLVFSQVVEAQTQVVSGIDESGGVRNPSCQNPPIPIEECGSCEPLDTIRRQLFDTAPFYTFRLGRSRASVVELCVEEGVEEGGK
ncbi:hypothetical protein ACS0TY_029687 [Phlomoides rotata]